MFDVLIREKRERMQQIAFTAVIWQCCRLCYLFSRSFIPDNMHSLLAFNHPRRGLHRLLGHRRCWADQQRSCCHLMDH